MDSVDLGPIRHALELAQEHGFREVELEIGDVSFEARLEPRKKVSVPSHDEMGAEPEPEEPLAPEPVAVAATCVGYFKVGPAPLEPGHAEAKFYAPGVGAVLEVDLASGERYVHESVIIAVDSARAIAHCQGLPHNRNSACLVAANRV